MKLKPKS